MAQRIVQHDKQGQLLDESGYPLEAPKGWSFLPAGDAGITRKVKAKGDSWKVEFRKGRRTMSKGIWAPSNNIKAAKQEVEDVRSTDTYARKMATAKRTRDNKQAAYVIEFQKALKTFLRFDEQYKELEANLINAVTEHAIPVGSGTVARTEMIPIEQRVAKAVIAWMRHKTTAYDTMSIAKVKGLRRKVRSDFAQESVRILNGYRRGTVVLSSCPLAKALKD